ncbi:MULTISPECIES: peptidylprolyl isomerase [Pseudomonas]|uniref:Chaperone SurA n=1 Tax=Pseudomonas nitroreducens TaxID=46680 RepID=A0A6G6IST5_PSENT|nr:MULTISPECIES: peptidylprolyl isomerase [Pseudomonas]MBG6288267.1 peptidylprolyl isomerase [Pseudomonas nitroreducens]MCJ1878605.1 peptidylprolyl isomerase [Pseudomonas nitroreducens]MCJ1896581.1 peptidylprolyl isomerase [Pseudomonas nitroreducens]MDG9852826.1 peptidylprolyl isomerase [Pseudomonas nitroreducens]MDH1071966.1 peptidylprolyl isomerase [Pseudomonas nitroreducens]
MKTMLCKALRPLMLGALLASSVVHAEVVPLDRVVAIVDNDVVMQSQLDQRLREVRATIQKRGAPLPPEHVLTQQVLERLIIENIQLQIGDRSGVRITDEELNQAMGTIAQRNNMSLDQFRAALAHDGLSYDEAREQVRREMIISRVRQRRVAERIQVSEQEVQNFLASDLGKIQLSEEYRLANILIPVPDSASPETVQAAARQAQEMYQQLKQGADFGQLAVSRSAGDNALEGGEIGWRKAAQLPSPFDSMVGTLAVGDVTEPVRTPGGFIIIKLEEKRGGSKMLRDEVHVRHILLKPSEIRSEEETQRLAEKLYERIQAGESFSDLAKKFSEDPGSKLNGGDLNWVDPESLVPEFRDVMNNAPQGQVTKPFRSPFGWHVLEVLGRRATDSSDKFREQQAAQTLRARKYDEELQAWLRQIRDEAYVEIKQ